ncbi:cytochrome P450 [Aspergillus karnatakaensis]|uniref:cytochrome P450 n=1 Tax=Aspergillus karnatakaensis TaxID=1810916 RepID=UPI003CCE000A
MCPNSGCRYSLENLEMWAATESKSGYWIKSMLHGLPVCPGIAQLGTIVRFGPNSVSINSHTGMSEIYSTRGNVVKANAYSVMSVSSHIPSTISCIDKKQHAAKRKTLARLFIETVLKGVEDRVLSHIDTLCASLGAGNQTHRFIPKVIGCVSRRNKICFVQPTIAKYKLDRIFLSTVSTQIRQFVTQADKCQSILTPKETWVELLQLVIAGADTTAVVISVSFFHLLQDPPALSQRHPTRPSLTSCTFLQACITESLRLSPPVTGLAPRKVLRGGIDIDGIHFSEGTIFGSPIYTLHRYGTSSLRMPFWPFGIGPQSFVAKRLALNEINVTVARTLYLQEMRLDAAWSHKNEYDLKGWMASGREGPYVCFGPRAESRHK